jgi:hypothetical protein
MYAVVYNASNNKTGIPEITGSLSEFYNLLSLEH